MPFWKRLSEEERQQRERALADAKASLASLEAGGLPLQAQRRLQEAEAVGHQIFSSDLSTNELALTHDVGYEPLSQVMGSSIYHVGWQYTRRYTGNPYASEMTTLTMAHQNGARLALSRMQQEAALLKAHGVIGVRFNTRAHAWGPGLLEYSAIGTAIRLPNTPLPKQPFMSDLSGQEFWTLYQAGYLPTGVVTGFCSYYVSLGSYLTGQLKSWWFGSAGQNMEITPFTQGFYTARDLAMTRLLQSARGLQAEGVVGLHIDAERDIMDYETETPKNYYMDLSVRFTIVGTAIRPRKAEHVIPAPRPTLVLTDLRPETFGQTSELTING